MRLKAHAMFAFAFAFALALGATGARADTPADCPRGTTDALTVAGSRLCALIDAPASAERIQRLETWVRRSASIVAAYYGRFPATSVAIGIHSSDGAGVHGGHTNNDPRLQIDVTVGQSTDAEQLADDWVLVHEMIHLALPEVGRRHDWLAEGLAVYVEGVARVQAGNRSAQDMWGEYRASMPRGLPAPGEGGMDETQTWARKYWGGALFCLQAEVAIREQTANRVGLQTALRAILNETGGYAKERDIDAVLAIGDRATGTHVLGTLYRGSGRAPVTPDLTALWGRLGIPADSRGQPFDDHAPLASIRKEITARP